MGSWFSKDEAIAPEQSAEAPAGAQSQSSKKSQSKYSPTKNSSSKTSIEPSHGESVDQEEQEQEQEQEQEDDLDVGDAVDEGVDVNALTIQHLNEQVASLMDSIDHLEGAQSSEP